MKTRIMHFPGINIYTLKPPETVRFYTCASGITNACFAHYNFKKL